MDLAVLELPGVVLYPGATFPIRLWHPSWMAYLGEQMDESRRNPLQAVCFGVLLRQAPEPPSPTSRRQSWTRQGYGPNRLRRWSQQLIEELGDLDHLSSSDEEPRRRSSSSASSRRRRPSRPAPPPKHPYIGRVGTIATVSYVHGPTDAGMDGQVVVTAKGTTRFRIVGTCGYDGGYESLSYTPRLRLFRVEAIQDRCVDVPSLRVFGRAHDGTKTPSETHRRAFRASMSIVSPLPPWIWKQAWPRSLMDAISHKIRTESALSGLLSLLKSTEDSPEAHILRDPIQFSFWLASNLALTETEKLRTLETVNTISRLRFLYEKLDYERKHASTLHCKTCDNRLASASDLFTVGGADGTTGNYVNEHGVVHQTLTLQYVQEDVWYSGGPQIRDSWFPGYSWTIMSCGICGSHLGWKFLRLRDDEAENRPPFFFGVSAGNVVTYPSISNSESQEDLLSIME